MNVEVQHIKFDDTVKPGWISAVDSNGRALKPVVKCNCGKYIGLKLHHVHADGRVTASFFHAAAHELQHDADGYFFVHNGKKYHTEPGCGWHVFLKLLDYSGGEFPSEQ